MLYIRIDSINSSVISTGYRIDNVISSADCVISSYDSKILQYDLLILSLSADDIGLQPTCELSLILSHPSLETSV